MQPYLKAYDKNGKLLATGHEVVGDRGSVIIPNLAPHTTYPEGSFFISWQAEQYETEKVAVPEFTTHESTYKEFAFYFKDHIVVKTKTAYDIAVDNGFTGTEEEWVKSIKGDKGDSGLNLTQGGSAYEYALDNGFEGTVDEWLDSLKGEKGDKGEPLKYSDLTTQQKEDLKSNITDQAVTDFVLKDNSISNQKLSNESVTIEKTTFLKTGKNIFNKNDIQKNKILSYTMGTLSDNISYVTSGFIPIKPNTQYTQSHSDIIVFYTQNKTMISGLSRSANAKEPRTFSTPSNAFYIRTTTINTSRDTYDFNSYQIEEGTEKTPYENYYEHITNLKTEIPNGSITDSKIADKNISLEKMSFSQLSENLFDKSKAKVGSYVNPSNGSLSTNASYYYSDFIDVTGINKLTKSDTNNLYAFYNSNKQFIANTNTSTSTISVPEGASYVRISILSANLNSTMLVNGETLPTKYVPFKIFIPKSFIETTSTIPESVYGEDNLKKYIADISKQMNPNATTRAEIAVIGDSWVQGGEFSAGDRLTLPLRNRMKDIYSDGGIGFVSFANNHVGNGSVSVTLNGSWAHYDEGLGNIAQSKGIDSAMVESSTVGDTIKVQFYENTDFYEIHTLNTGKWRYNIDGGEWVEVDASIQEVTTLNYPLGKHIINIEIVSGTVTFIGSYSYKGEKGIVIHKVGNGGLRAGHIASTNRSNWVKQLQRCKANTYAILLGTNDMAQNITLSDFERDIKEVISRIKEAKPLSSIILIAPSGNKYDGSRNNTMADFSDVLLKISKELEISYVSLYRTLGDFTTTNANGLMYSDGVHPNRDGGYAISNVIYDRLLRI